MRAKKTDETSLCLLVLRPFLLIIVLGVDNVKKRNIILILILLVLISLPILGFTIYNFHIESQTNIVSEEQEVLIDLVEDEPEEIEQIIEEPKITNINILAVGDIMFHSPQYKAAYNKEGQVYDFTSTFKYIKKYVEPADLAIGNFETVTAGEEAKFSGYPQFNTPEESLLALKNVGFDILSTANNHCLDRGKKGIISTIDNITKYEMKNIGTYKEPGDNILVQDIEGIKIGFLSYTYGLNGLNSLLAEEELAYMVNLIDEDKIKNDIEKAKNLDVDLIVVFIHWGYEYHREPSESQIQLGEKMVEWGANIILGSHPHVIQKSQIINKDGRDNFIIYSMGNFLSNQRKETSGNPYTEDGIMINLEIEKNFALEETVIKNIQYIPTWVYKYRIDNKLNFEILPIEDVLNGEINLISLDNIKVRIEKSKNDTMAEMTQN